MVTKNSKPIELPKIGELDDESKVNQAVKGAALNERVKSKGGRKKKSDEEKSNILPPFGSNTANCDLVHNIYVNNHLMILNSLLK